MNVTENLTIRELISKYPQTRVVLDRYGLKGCGGLNGPAESLRFFARAHGVDFQDLARELEEVMAKPATAAPQELKNPADTIYRRFFKAGIVTTLTAGAAWGAILLLTIGLKGKFTAISIFDINAHGHAQIFGWVGLFVMGFAYQAFPRFKHTSLWNPPLAVFTFYLMVVGLGLRTISEPLHHYIPMLRLGLLSGFMELTAILLFLIILFQTFRRSQKPLVYYDYYIGTALFWFLAQAVLDIFHYYLTTTAPTRDALLQQVATWQAPLRDLQIHGFALTLILGVSQRFLPGMFGFPEVPRHRSIHVLGALTAGIAGEALFFLLFRKTAQPFFAALMYASMVVIAAAVVALTRNWWAFLWTNPAGLPSDIVADRSDRSFKFIRAAYAWLYLSLALLLFVPFHNQLTRQAFSHAFYGATRHAITVGFISLMILGVAAKVVPVLNGIDAKDLSQLWLPFFLVNIGCALRVSTQILTDLVPGAFSVIGLSGILEVTGISIWGMGLWRAMRAGTAREGPVGKLLPKPLSIRPEDKVGLVVDAAPELLEVFARFGFGAIRNPLLRRTVARQTTIRQACWMHGIDEIALIEALNGVLKTSHSACEPFPIIDTQASIASLVNRENTRNTR